MRNGETANLFRDRYRIASTRLRGWDYTSPGLYFVTICVKDRVPCLAKIVDGAVRLSPIGDIVAEEWQRTAQIRANVILDAWVIMPNHFHGIIGIIAPNDANARWGDDNAPRGDDTPRDDDNAPRGDAGTRRDDAGAPRGDDTPRGDADARRDDAGAPRDGLVETPRRGVSTTTTTTTTTAASAAWKSNSLGAIIGQFKSVCTKRIWRAGYRDFAWQARFYDRIVRNERALNQIRAYIANNPVRWETDRNNREDVWM